MKIIDCFIFYNELDMLELRLTELNDIVDFFVLVECTKTHSNDDKELYFENNKDRFSKYLDKIVHIIVKDNIPQTCSFDREIYQRNCIDDGIKKLNLNSEDILIITDLDEIPDSKTVQDLKNNNAINGIYYLEMDLYYYNITCIYHKKWLQPKILNYDSYIKNDCKPHVLTHGGGNFPIIKNGGWHFSYFGDIEFIKNKVKNSSSHNLFNYLENLYDNDRITKQIKNCSDFFERPQESLTYIDVNNITYLPYKYEEFKDLLNIKVNN
jgi:beta-1,4-mannosyl-glycoprotein beta-1,4-N-acetylglucosaminyltransferase